jgi:hypothetical protein
MSVVTSIYNVLKYDILTKATNLITDTVNCALFSASTFTAADTAYNTNGTEVANANGYLTGGMSVSTRTVTGTTTQVWKITGGSGATQWTATGAGFTAVAAKLYSTTNSNRPIAHIDFGGSFTASGGGAFTITWDATNGVFNLT